LRESEAGNGTEGKDDLPLELIFLSPVSAYTRAFTTSADEPFTSVIYSMRLFSAKSKTGEFLSQSVFRAKVCAWKTSIGSSIQAQESGEVMRRKWRGYGNSYNPSFDMMGLVPDASPELLRNQVGPRIMFFSAGPESNIVGATANILLEIDEAQDVAIEKYDRESRVP
jgi:hypothetical protein